MTSSRPIPIRTVQTFAATGASLERRFVCCPLHEHSATLDACAACPHHVTGRADDDFVMCDVPEEPHGGPVAWAADRQRVHQLADQTPVTAAMTRDVTCVRVGDSLDAVRELLVTREIGGAPVVDQVGRPIGVVSKSDLVRDHQQQHQQRRGGPRTAGAVMTAFVATVPETASLSQVADLMGSTGIHRVVVVSAVGAVAGIVSTLDLLRWLAKPHDPTAAPRPSAAVRARIPAARSSVSSLMSSRVVCVEPGVSAEQLATIFLDEQISGAPVVAGGVSVGVVSKTDLVESHQALPLLRATQREVEPHEPAPGSDTQVNELMTLFAISVREHTSVLRAATIMVEQGVHRVPVLTDDGRVVGLLTALDIARWLAARDTAASGEWSEPEAAGR